VHRLVRRFLAIAGLVDALLDPSQSRLVKLSGQQLQPAPRRCRDLLL
jgi:hypothetical protein